MGVVAAAFMAYEDVGLQVGHLQRGAEQIVLRDGAALAQLAGKVRCQRCLDARPRQQAGRHRRLAGVFKADHVRARHGWHRSSQRLINLPLPRRRGISFRRPKTASPGHLATTPTAQVDVSETTARAVHPHERSRDLSTALPTPHVHLP